MAWERVGNLNEMKGKSQISWEVVPWSGREDSNLRPLGPNYRFAKELSFCLFESCSYHEFIRDLHFLSSRYQRIPAMCC